MRRKILAIILVITLIMGNNVGVLAAETILCRDESSPRASSVDNFEYEMLGDGNVAITDYSGDDTEVIIPSHIEGGPVTRIEEDVFWGCDFESVEIPDTVLTIGEYAFYRCDSLKTVDIPNSVVEIGDRAFSRCDNLEMVYVSNSLEKCGESVFEECVSLTAVSLAEGITVIPSNMFKNCKALERVDIPNGVKVIEYGVFDCCDNLKYVSMPDTVEEISQAFYSTDSIILYANSNTYTETYATKYNIPFVSLDKGYTTPNMYPFWIYGMENYYSSIWVGDNIRLKREYEYEIIEGNENAVLEYNENDECDYIRFMGEGTAKLKVTNVGNEVEQVFEFRIHPAQEMYMERFIPETIKIGYELAGYGKWFCKYHNCLLGTDSFQILDTDFAEYFIRPDSTGYGGEPRATRIHSQGGLFIKDEETIWLRGIVSKPGKFYFVTEKEPDKKYEVFIETPIIKTNLPEKILVGTELLITSELINTELQNCKVSVVKAAIEDMGQSFPKSDFLGYQPRIEIISGEELVERGYGDYTNILNSEEKMKFVGEGEVTFKIVYEMIPIPTTNYCVMPEEAVYSPEKIYTVHVQKDTTVLDDSNITLNISSYTYDGREKQPTVTVKFGNKTLILGTDYTVSYKNNAAVGTATVIVIGKGNYTGTVSKSFTITAKSIENATATLSATSYSYNGKIKTPTVTVKLGNTSLRQDTDYKVTYANNKNIGKATVTITGTGNYTGKIIKNFTITLAKGKTFTSGAYKYKVTGSNTVAFAGIKSKTTKKVAIAKTVKYGGKTFKITSIADKALKGKNKVTKVTISANVTTIGKSAFEGCTNLSTVTIGSKVTKIGDKAFKKCTTLKSITVPSKVTTIGKEVFNGCKKLKTITIKSTKLKSVGKNAFKGIQSKAKIKVPKSKLTPYKKLLKSRGQGSKVKITK